MSSTNRGAKRMERDAYPTPGWAVEAMAEKIVWHGGIANVLEPCIGTGVIADVLLSNYVDSVDWAEIEQGRDFLTYEFGRKFDFVVTNPPFSLAKEFIDRSLTLANCVIMLLPLSFMGSKKRRDWWRSHPYTAIFYLSQRPSFTNDGKTDSECYAWVVFDSTGRQKIGCHWI